MNPPDPQSEAVWNRTLPQIRSTRRKRKLHRIAGAGAGAACSAFALWFTLQSPKTPDPPTALSEPTLPKIATMAVMRMDENGAIRLQEIATNELGSIELTFGETPFLPPEMAVSEISSFDFPWF